MKKFLASAFLLTLSIHAMDNTENLNLKQNTKNAETAVVVYNQRGSEAEERLKALVKTFDDSNAKILRNFLDFKIYNALPQPINGTTATAMVVYNQSGSEAEGRLKALVKALRSKKSDSGSNKSNLLDPLKFHLLVSNKIIMRDCDLIGEDGRLKQLYLQYEPDFVLKFLELLYYKVFAFNEKKPGLHFHKKESESHSHKKEFELRFYPNSDTAIFNFNCIAALPIHVSYIHLENMETVDVSLPIFRDIKELYLKDIKNISGFLSELPNLKTLSLDNVNITNLDLRGSSVKILHLLGNKYTDENGNLILPPFSGRELIIENVQTVRLPGCLDIGVVTVKDVPLVHLLGSKCNYYLQAVGNVESITNPSMGPLDPPLYLMIKDIPNSSLTLNINRSILSFQGLLPNSITTTLPEAIIDRLFITELSTNTITVASNLLQKVLENNMLFLRNISSDAQDLSNGLSSINEIYIDRSLNREIKNLGNLFPNLKEIRLHDVRNCHINLRDCQKLCDVHLISCSNVDLYFFKSDETIQFNLNCCKDIKINNKLSDLYSFLDEEDFLQRGKIYGYGSKNISYNGFDIEGNSGTDSDSDTDTDRFPFQHYFLFRMPLIISREF